MTRTCLAALACALLLSGCGGGAAPTWGNDSVPSVGGSAGQMGPGFCQQVPADVGRRNQWMDLCMPN